MLWGSLRYVALDESYLYMDRQYQGNATAAVRYSVPGSAEAGAISAHALVLSGGGEERALVDSSVSWSSASSWGSAGDVSLNSLVRFAFLDSFIDQIDGFFVPAKFSEILLHHISFKFSFSGTGFAFEILEIDVYQKLQNGISLAISHSEVNCYNWLV